MRKMKCHTCHNTRSYPETDKFSYKIGEIFIMNKTTMTYFSESDIVHLAVSDEKEAESIELSPNITAELNDRGELIGIEILNASTYLRDSVLETAQARLLKIRQNTEEISTAIESLRNRQLKRCRSTLPTGMPVP